MLRVNNFRGHSLNLSEVMCIAPEIEEKYTRTRILENDVLISVVGSVGQVVVVPKELSGWNIARAIALIRPKEPGLSRWISFVLRSPDIGYQLGVVANTTVQTTINLKDLRQLRIPLPDRRERDAIAHILGTLDDKIELNRRQSETLQEMARALFKAWFVDFEPVRAKMSGRWQRGQTLPGLPAHLWDIFPNRLVETEHGEVPQGWRLFTFGDVARQGKGTVTPGNLPGETFTHYSIPAFDEGQIPVHELGEAIKSNKTPVPDNSLLLSKLNPHIPRVWLIGAAGSNAVCSTEFIVWVPKEPANSAFLYCLASSPEFNTIMRQLVTGTSNSHQRVKPEQLCGISIFAANSQAIQSFSEIVHSLMAQAIENRQQSNTLAALRDTLLPQLLSGALRVADAEKFLQDRGA